MLAPFLEEFGSAQRRTDIPKRSFWTAAHRIASPADQAILANRADGYGLYRLGAMLRTAAVTAGEHAHSARLLRRVPNPSVHLVRWLVEHTSVSDLRQWDDLAEELDQHEQWSGCAELVRRATHTADLTDPDITRVVDRLARLQDATATTAFLERHPALSLATTRWTILAPLARLDHAEAEIFAQRVLADNVEHLAWLTHQIIGAGFGHVIRAHVLTLNPEQLPEEVIRIADTLHDHGLSDAVRHLIGLIDPAELRLRSLHDAVSLLRVLHSLDGQADAVSAIVTTVNADSQLRQWYTDRKALLEGLAPQVRERLHLDPQPPPAPLTPGQGLVVDLVPYLQAQSVAMNFAAEWGPLTAASAGTAARTVDVSDLDRLLALLWHLRTDGHHNARAVLVRRIDLDRLPTRINELSALARELGPGSTAESVMARVVAECDTRYSKYTRRTVLSALEEIDATSLIARLAWRIADAGNFQACITLLPDVADQFPYGREPDRTATPRWSWSDLP